MDELFKIKCGDADLTSELAVGEPCSVEVSIDTRGNSLSEIFHDENPILFVDVIAGDWKIEGIEAKKPHRWEVAKDQSLKFTITPTKESRIQLGVDIVYKCQWIFEGIIEKVAKHQETTKWRETINSVPSKPDMPPRP